MSPSPRWTGRPDTAGPRFRAEVIPDDQPARRCADRSRSLRSTKSVIVRASRSAGAVRWDVPITQTRQRHVHFVGTPLRWYSNYGYQIADTTHETSLIPRPRIDRSAYAGYWYPPEG